MRATHLLSRVLLALLGPGLGVTLQGPVGELGLSNTEQLERTVRDINRLEATLEKALPANLRAIANVSQNWSPLDEEQVRQEAEVNAAVADATREERRASEQLAAARAQAAAVGARRQVHRFVSAGMLSLSPPPPSPSAQTSQQLALEAQEVRCFMQPITTRTPPYNAAQPPCPTYPPLIQAPTHSLRPYRPVARHCTRRRSRCEWPRSPALLPAPCQAAAHSSRSRSRSSSKYQKQVRAAPPPPPGGPARVCAISPPPRPPSDSCS